MCELAESFSEQLANKIGLKKVIFRELKMEKLTFNCQDFTDSLNLD